MDHWSCGLIGSSGPKVLQTSQSYLVLSIRSEVVPTLPWWSCTPAGAIHMNVWDRYVDPLALQDVVRAPSYAFLFCLWKLAGTLYFALDDAGMNDQFPILPFTSSSTHRMYVRGNCLFTTILPPSPVMVFIKSFNIQFHWYHTHWDSICWILHWERCIAHISIPWVHLVKTLANRSASCLYNFVRCGTYIAVQRRTCWGLAWSTIV